VVAAERELVKGDELGKIRLEREARGVLPGEQAPAQDAEGEDIAGGAGAEGRVLAAHDDLRGDVGGGADECARDGERVGVPHGGSDAEVDQLDVLGDRRALPEAVGDEHVVELEIAVDDLALVKVREGADQVAQQPHPVGLGEGGLLGGGGEGLAVDPLEDQAQEIALGILEHAEATDQRGVVELLERFGLAPQPLHVGEGRAVGRIIGASVGGAELVELEGDDLTGAIVDGFPDGALPSLSDLCNQPVAI
jgi:hypothetical protein